MNKLQYQISKMTTPSIVDCIKNIGGDYVDQDTNTARAALLSEYEKREGGEALDNLLDEMGM